MASVIKTENLQKTFRTKEKLSGLSGSFRSVLIPQYRDVKAVKGLDLDIKAGETVAFIGPNGSGKSTTIKMLTGILYPTAGTAQVNGLNPWKQRQELVYQISVMFGQRSHLWYHLPPIDSFELLSRIYSQSSITYKRHLNTLIELFEIHPFINTPVRKLSLGQRMRCELVGALLHQPSLVFLDEPTIGLDIVSKLKMRSYLAELNRSSGVTVFLTSHDTDDIEQLCRHVILIHEGSVIFSGTVSELKRHYGFVKIIDIELFDQYNTFNNKLPGTEMIRRADYSLTFRVDTSVQTIDTAIAHIVTNHKIRDMVITDPPLDEVIARMYGEEGKHHEPMS